MPLGTALKLLSPPGTTSACDSSAQASGISELKVGERRRCITLHKKDSKRATPRRGRRVFAAMMWFDALCQDLEKDSAGTIGSALYRLSSRQGVWGQVTQLEAPVPHPRESWLLASRRKGVSTVSEGGPPSQLRPPWVWGHHNVLPQVQRIFHFVGRDLRISS